MKIQLKEFRISHISIADSTQRESKLKISWSKTKDKRNTFMLRTFSIRTGLSPAHQTRRVMQTDRTGLSLNFATILVCLSFGFDDANNTKTRWCTWSELFSVSSFAFSIHLHNSIDYYNLINAGLCLRNRDCFFLSLFVNLLQETMVE